MSYERMLDGEHQPTEADILKSIGKKKVWLDLKQYLEQNYDFVPELVFYGAKYGWTIRYRKSGKTFCSLFPEKGAFTVLLVLGKQEAQKALSMLNEFSTRVGKLVNGAEQRRDGRWLWIRVVTSVNAADVKELLKVKRKPKRK